MRGAIVTLSDKGFKGEREDVSGNVIREIAEGAGITVTESILLPDEYNRIVSELTRLAEQNEYIFTTGGTGFSKRDVTPEATRAVIERECPGVAAAMVYNGLRHTERAMLSRAVCGIRGGCIIVNLPGSPKAVRENLEYILPSLIHGGEILAGGGECAR